MNDSHRFTGSLEVTGSFKLNGYEVNEISNDEDFNRRKSNSTCNRICNIKHNSIRRQQQQMKLYI